MTKKKTFFEKISQYHYYILFALLLITAVCVTFVEIHKIKQEEKDFESMYEPRPYQYVTETAALFLSNKDGKWLSHIPDSTTGTLVELKANLMCVEWIETGEKYFIGYSLSPKLKSLGVILDIKADSTTYRYGEYSATFPGGALREMSILQDVEKVGKEYEKMINARRDAYFKKYLDGDKRESSAWMYHIFHK